ncbi:MAG: Na+:solute symporter [Planctomycetaceae bacterium]|nr:Na+:solute symporter [Planctomycetaceae bacterium]
MKHLYLIDYTIIALYFLPMIVIAWVTMRRAGKSSSEFFLSSRTMPWWLLGFSLVSTTFAADTPLLVTGLVRKYGVAGNWLWWAFLLTGMTTVFIYAKLWRRIGVMTDIEFYEVRYSGKPAAFLRGFRTIYIGLVFNTMVMAAVTLAMLKIAGTMLGTPPIYTLILGGAITLLVTMLGGFTAVIWVDFLLFLVAMAGAILAAIFVLGIPEVGGLSGLFGNECVRGKMSIFPDFSNTDAIITLLVIPLAVQWWSVWYPGAEPGGGSYVAQRMLAAKNEAHSVGAVLFFNFCHYAVRPWPWIIVALASLIVFPDLESLQERFPHMENMVRDDLAYPAMLTFLPPGLFGLVFVSLLAAYMSTIATQLNLGASYLVNDFYHRYINRNASEKQLVMAGRVSTVVIMILASLIAVHLRGAVESFEILLIIGAGTGLLFMLRWFWWRISAYSEIAAMAIALPVALFFKMGGGERLGLSPGWELVIAVAITTVGWIIATLLTPSDDPKVLREFLRRTRANGPGWQKIIDEAARDGEPIPDAGEQWSVPIGIFCSVIGCIAVYAALFAAGAFLYGNHTTGIVLTVIAAISGASILLLWNRVSGERE